MTHNIGDVINVPKNEQAFQGDVFIDVISLPKDAVEMKPNAKGLYVFAEGESTGHVHAIRSNEAKVYTANDNSRVGGKRFFVVSNNDEMTMFHGVPGTRGFPTEDKGDHGWLKIFKPSKKGNVFEVVRQRVLDLMDPSSFRQVAD